MFIITSMSAGVKRRRYVLPTYQAERAASSTITSNTIAYVGPGVA
jgi:hypothetical protein